MPDFYNPFTLEGKTVLVTGASSGIGRDVAISCSKMGAKVIITGRNSERLDQTYFQLVSDGHLSIVADLSEEGDVRTLVESLPKVDGIVHCAGIGNRIPCKQVTSEVLQSVMKSNFDAPILLQASLLSSKKINKSASIVFIASRAANSPSIGNSIYSASKGAVISYSKCLALELAPRQIRVNCICPGMVWTDLIKNTLSQDELLEAEQKYPLKRFGKVEDVSNLALYLLSNASSWMTGVSIDISGGGEGVLV